MIKANELRIGNLLNYDTSEGDVVVITTDFGTMQWATVDPKGFNLVHSPIPLTEDWLVKLGFEKTMTWTYTIDLLGSLKLVYYLGEKGWSLGFKNYSDFSNLKYLHELQNLYFALTGKELEMKGGNNE